MHLLGEEVSERYEYIPAQFIVIEDVCKKYACACTIKTATKPPQPIAKSSAGASLLAQVIVGKIADHMPCTGKGKSSRDWASTLRTRPWADGCANQRNCVGRCMGD